MSKYTTELRYLIEMNFDLGLKNYPIFDETYRAGLNAKIIDHFFFREIGFETASLFKHYLNRTMNEIMPYYNQLYKSELIKFDPMITRQLIEDYTRDNKNLAEQTNNATAENNSQNIFSDTPQGLLSVVDVQQDLYASSANIDHSTGTSDSVAKTAGSSEENFKRGINGYDGDSSELLKNFRTTFLNIDMLVIDELETLFMGLW